MRIFIFIFLLSFAISCHVQNSEHALSIIQGQPTDPDTPIARATVALFANSSAAAGPICSGVLIAPRIALTAAHCADQAEQAVWLKLDASLRTETPATEGVMISHPGYFAPYREMGFHFDIALVFLSDDIPDSVPVLIGEKSSLMIGAEVILAGFGVTSEKRVDAESSLHEATVSLQYIGDMEDIYEEQGALYYHSPQASGACYGDSGGPMFISGDNGLSVIGIAHGEIQARDGCHAGKGLYVNILFWQEWIDQTITARTE